MKAFSFIIIMGWMARVAVMVFSVGGANTINKILSFYHYYFLHILFFFTLNNIHYMKEESLHRI
ncbi:hypothetical protein COL60_27660 [Bacillus pseudomycoides]|nr:hypothetical protein COL60_27660 [Bacillus pseudomycoides]